MIILYRETESLLADEIQEALQDFVIAHEIRIISNDEINPFPDLKLPIILDEGKPISGEHDLRKKLESLGNLMKMWDLFKSDACYVDNNINTCED